MPVYDFNNSPKGSNEPVCTYTVFYTNEPQASAENPLLVLDNRAGELKHHSSGVFTNPVKRTAFEFQGEDGTVSADILRIDARFVSLLKWMGENHINVRLSGASQNGEYAVYKIREIAFGGGVKLSAEDGFLQFMGSGAFTRGIRRRAQACPARAFYYDEYPVEGKLFPAGGPGRGKENSG